MKLKEAQDHYAYHSGAASAAARQLAFAGIAVVWILAAENGVVVVESNGLRFPLFSFVVTLSFDLLQYYSLAAFWGGFARYKENKGETEFSGAPRWGNWIGIACFWGKGLAVAIGYLFLGKILWPVLFT